MIKLSTLAQQQYERIVQLPECFNLTAATDIFNTTYKPGPTANNCNIISNNSSCADCIFAGSTDDSCMTEYEVNPELPAIVEKIKQTHPEYFL